jgi:TATA-box binding protein (TBP) (component of TFIID and TFIIIB)
MVPSRQCPCEGVPSPNYLMSVEILSKGEISHGVVIYTQQGEVVIQNTVASCNINADCKITELSQSMQTCQQTRWNVRKIETLSLE